MNDRIHTSTAFERMSTEALVELLRRERDPEELLRAEAALRAHPDAKLPRADVDAALERFRAEYLPTTALDPDAPEQPRAPRRLMRVLPLAAILVLALGMLVYAGQRQERALSTSTVITRHDASSDIDYVHTDGVIPSFGITLPSRFELEETAPDGETDTLLYRDIAQPSRTVKISFATGDGLSYAAKDPDHHPTEEITLPNFNTPCFLTDFGDTIEIAAFDFTHSNVGCLIVIETHDLSRAEALAAAESLHLLTVAESAS
ncbi:MAG: hypothetical protein IJ112_05360 [Oscillospiraceae bacterium]|nr:hypothetical protein [Oscillospiraceae bacterium]